MIITKNDKRLKDIINRGDYFEGEYLPAVMEIIANVKKNGDAAVIDYTNRFDKFDITTTGMEISKETIKAAYDKMPDDLKNALLKAKERIIAFHEKQYEKTWMYEEKGAILGQKITPMDRAGVYVPGGKAAYPSSVLMNVLPAKVAGVKEIIMVTPTPNGIINETVLGAAYIAGVDRVFRIGGAQAVAALAFGTATIPKVDKIVGPGNIYVALAKKMVFGVVDIDMIAGPSEILVIADSDARPDWVAADMLSQAEHDELASAIAITTDNKHAILIQNELMKQLDKLPRKEIAKKSVEKYCYIIVVDDLKEACEISNKIAPEHLELYINSPMEYLKYIKHAGAIFMGGYTPEATGDYYAGPNHVLPTSGTARFFSPLGVYDFIKRSSIIYYSKELFDEGADDIQLLAESEGLTAHRQSINIRKNS